MMNHTDNQDGTVTFTKDDKSITLAVQDFPSGAAMRKAAEQALRK